MKAGLAAALAIGGECPFPCPCQFDMSWLNWLYTLALGWSCPPFRSNATVTCRAQFPLPSFVKQCRVHYCLRSLGCCLHQPNCLCALRFTCTVHGSSRTGRSCAWGNHRCESRFFAFCHCESTRGAYLHSWWNSSVKFHPFYFLTGVGVTCYQASSRRPSYRGGTVILGGGRVYNFGGCGLAKVWICAHPAGETVREGRRPRKCGVLVRATLDATEV